MNFPYRLILASAVVAMSSIAHAESEPAGVFFVSPPQNQTVQSPVKLVFGLTGKQIGPVGNMSPELGHHHLIIDGGALPKGTSIPADAQNLHFGKGQTETTVELSPGQHQLTLQFGNGAHQSYGDAMSKTITVTVAKP